MLRTLRLRAKFSLLALLAIVLISIPTSLYVVTTSKVIAQKAREASVLPFERAAFETLRNMQKHRGAASVALAAQDGDASMLTEPSAGTDAAAQKALEALAGAPEKLVGNWRSVIGKWQSLGERVRQRQLSSKESYEAHTALISELLEVNSAMVDAYGLSLDSDAESFRLVSIALLDVPALVEDLGKARASGTRILASGVATPADIVNMTNLAERAQEHAGNVYRGLERLAEEFPAFGNKIVSDFSEAQRMSGHALDVLDKRIVKASAVDMPSKEYLDIFTNAINANFDVDRSAIDALEALLNQQATALRTRQLTVLAPLVVLLLAGVWVAAAIIRSITGPLNAAVGLAGSVANGDLTVHVDHSGSDECADLLRALNSMTEGLSRIAADVRAGSDSIHSASHQIASGNRDLSTRTEEQASSLEQTAASMTELTETVRHNAENARLASELALGARDLTHSGSSAVRAMVTTIEQINQSSAKVTEITGMIEGIAFQTNILALNAAVEAARAGEQGRGFAVVAGEVRSLAQRSAAAAKEIKDLIAASSIEVQHGARQAAEVSSAMGDVDGAITKVTEIVREIASASDEQSQGIQQVHQAISQIDAVTQQNAALVEESATAAQSLEELAGRMHESMAFFRLAATVPALR